VGAKRGEIGGSDLKTSQTSPISGAGGIVRAKTKQAVTTLAPVNKPKERMLIGSSVIAL
jgi:hypothetical protein